MRLFGMQLRVPRPSFEGFPSVRRRSVLYVAYTLLLFLIFVVINFPYHALVRRFLDQAHLGALRLDVQDAHFAWWKGCELRGVKLMQAAPDGEMPSLLESRSLYVRPGLAGLIRGKLSWVQVSGVMYNGDVVATWGIEDGTQRVTVSLEALELGRHPQVSGLLEEGQIMGRISGLFSVEPQGDDIAAVGAAGDIALASGRMVGAKIRGFSIPDLTSCSAEAKLGVATGRLEIQEFRLECDEVKMTVSGNVTYQARLGDSRLNLQIATEPGPKVSEGWKLVVPLVPCSLSGTVDRPRGQPCGASAPTRGRRR